jgi:hypothetical protein
MKNIDVNFMTLKIHKAILYVNDNACLSREERFGDLVRAGFNRGFNSGLVEPNEPLANVGCFIL